MLATSLLAIAPTASAATAPAPTPVVKGNHLVDTRTNTIWVPRGVDFPSFEYACAQGWGYSNGGDTAAAANAMRAWGVNTVRLPLNEGCWMGTVGDPTYGTASGYRDAVEAWVEQLHTVGIVVELDLHWTRPPGASDDEQYAAPSSRSTAFWSSVASEFKDDKSVLFDLFNEPYSVWDDAKEKWAFTLTWDCWRNGGCDVPTGDQNSTPSEWTGTYKAVGMQQLVTAVRAAGAAQPIVLSGLDWANDVSGWWANRPDDAQLVAGYHGYEGNSCSTQSGCWDTTLATLATHAPIVASEFGSTEGDAAWFSSFMTWADAHDVGYLAWAWWGSDSDGGPNRYLTLLASDTTFAPTSPIGTTLQSHLQALARTTPTAPPKTAPPTTAPPPPKPPVVVHHSKPARGDLVTVRRIDRRHLSASGWALDPDTRTGHPTVLVSVDGHVRARLIARSHRIPPHAYRAWGTHHGFAIRIGVHAPGRHRVCATAIDYHGTARTPLGCMTVRT